MYLILKPRRFPRRVSHIVEIEMQKIEATLSAMLVVGFVATVQAETPTQVQREEFNRFLDEGVIDRVELEDFLVHYRGMPIPEGCTRAEVDYGVHYEQWKEEGSLRIAPYILRGAGWSGPAPRYRNKKVVKELCWFRFKSPQTFKEVREKNEAGNFLLADLWELKAFAKVFPEVFLEIEIQWRMLAVGSWWVDSVDYLKFPFLHKNGDDLHLSINRNDGEKQGWKSDTRFLAIRK